MKKEKMEKEFSQKEQQSIVQFLQNKQFDELEKWIDNDPHKAKEVFSHFQSLISFDQMQKMITPTQEMKINFKKKQFKELIVQTVKNGLQLIMGEEHLLVPKPGWVRSRGTSEKMKDVLLSILDFKAFKIQSVQKHGGNHGEEGYLLVFSNAKKVIVIEKVEDKENQIYTGHRVTEKSLVLGRGEYRIEVNDESWSIRLQ